MGDSAFDGLMRTFAANRSRRRLLGQLSTLPLAGLLASVGENAAAKRPRHGRRASHRPGKDKKNRTGEHHRSTHAQEECPCAFPCGPYPNVYCTCQVCPPACAKSCPAPACTHTTLQSALDAAANGDTIYVCPGTYKRPGGADQPVANIIRPVTLLGAGQGTGAGSTILDGGGLSGTPVVNVWGGINVTLSHLTVTGADGNPGISIAPRDTTLHLQAVSVIDNHYTTPMYGLGGGILTKYSTVVLDDQTVVSDNQAIDGAGIFSLQGAVKLNSGSSVTGNQATSPNGAGISFFGDLLLERNGGVISGNTPYDCRYADGQPCY